MVGSSAELQTIAMRFNRSIVVVPLLLALAGCGGGNFSGGHDASPIVVNSLLAATQFFGPGET